MGTTSPKAFAAEKSVGTKAASYLPGKAKKVVAAKSKKTWTFDRQKTRERYKNDVRQVMPNIRKVLPVLTDVANATHIKVSELAALYYRETSAGTFKTNNKSSAGGATQIMSGTYLGVVKNLPLHVIQRHDPRTAAILKVMLARGVPESSYQKSLVLSTRHSSVVSFLAAAANLKSSYKTASQMGVRLTSEDIYLTHVYGGMGAAKIKQASMDTPHKLITQVLNVRALRNNHIPTQGANVPSVREFYNRYVEEHRMLVREFAQQLSNPGPQYSEQIVMLIKKWTKRPIS